MAASTRFSARKVQDRATFTEMQLSYHAHIRGT